MKQVIKAALLFIWSLIIVWISVFFDGKELNSGEELKEALPFYIGFPVPFLELTSSTIDPPLPFTYNRQCCVSMFHEDLYWQGVAVTFLASFILFEIAKYLFIKYRN
ncbi:hypothetical protein [Bacillus sp. UMB0893]|uniref:hypothetical protein n=1 Tax=Bacillus sp. UMB0893 TaxID=2066053 RepID=UPI000C77B1DC|nr:hypothetical protein [Bacillus sp. UMB0893]PLR69093.1 hypothetical protein CYJ36_01130 [Bacillus sp. UMB0893]QNG59447.1 hypothetical protein H4O14_16855 [Bacillus sp. PAMC26568]